MHHLANVNVLEEIFPVNLLKISSKVCGHSDGWRLAEMQMSLRSVL